MACHSCGDCNYSDSSTVTIFRKVTSEGMDPNCEPDSEMTESGLAYESPGKWKKTASGRTITAKSKCLAGEWLYSITVSGPGGGGFPAGGSTGEGCGTELPDSTAIEPIQDDCDGFHHITTWYYPNNRWVREELKISVHNNSECT